jgi:hypothetical protein
LGKGSSQAAIVEGTLAAQVAVAQQHRVDRLVGPQHHGEAAHHVGTVRPVGDAAETLGLALGEKGVTGHVQARQPGVAARRAGGDDLQRERLGQLVQAYAAVGLGIDVGFAVEQQRLQRDVLAVEQQRRGRRRARHAPHLHAAFHARAFGIEVEFQGDLVDRVGGRFVLQAGDHGGLVGAHGIHSVDASWRIR